MIAIINACGANIASVQFALQRLGKRSIITTDRNIIKSASHVILPGVGMASRAMFRLDALKLTNVIRELQQPVLGICLGMQILYESSNEGNVSCLGILLGNIASIPRKFGLPIPHMGWNQLQITSKQTPLLEGVKNGSHVYFVHSYFASLNSHTLAETQHGIKFSSVVQQKNFYGVQFHPERSGEVGQRILENFCQQA